MKANLRQVIGAVLALAAALAFCSEQGRTAEQPNIVLIFADDLGIFDLSCYGREDQPTPRLDQMAAEGIRFTSAYCSQPICSPSRAGILAGKSPARLQITTFIPGRANAKSQKVLHPQMRMQLPHEEKTLAEYLQDEGYATACIGKWHLGGQGFTPKEQGFDTVFAGQANTQPSEIEGGKGEYQLTTQAVKFIEANQEEPFFLYLAHNTPHIPLAAKPELIEKHEDAFNPTYAAMMETLDDCVGIVLDKLKALGLDEKTIVIFTSDNGGLHVLEFPDGPATHNGPYRGGKGFVYEGGLREPMIVRWPGKFKPAVVDTPISHLDVVPTLLTLASAKVPEGLDGIDISGLLLGTDKPAPRQFVWHFPHYNNQGGRPAGALRDGDWKFVTYYDTGEVQLFNLKDDVGELKNLASEEADKAAELHKQHSAWCQEAKVQTNTPNPDFDAALFQQLYTDVDPSRPERKPTSVEMGKDMQTWRDRMNEVVRGAPRPNQTKKKKKQ
jgi:arylsulfatase A